MIFFRNRWRRRPLLLLLISLFLFPSVSLLFHSSTKKSPGRLHQGPARGAQVVAVVVEQEQRQLDHGCCSSRAAAVVSRRHLLRADLGRRRGQALRPAAVRRRRRPRRVSVFFGMGLFESTGRERKRARREKRVLRRGCVVLLARKREKKNVASLFSLFFPEKGKSFSRSLVLCVQLL